MLDPTTTLDGTMPRDDSRSAGGGFAVAPVKVRRSGRRARCII